MDEGDQLAEEQDRSSRQDGLEQVLAHEGHDHGRQGGVAYHGCSSCQRSVVPSSGNGLLGLRAFVKLRSGRTGADVGDPTGFRQDLWPHPQAPRLAQTTIGLSRMVRRSGSGCRAQTVLGAYRHIGLHLLERREHAPTPASKGSGTNSPRDVEGAIDLDLRPLLGGWCFSRVADPWTFALSRWVRRLLRACR